jgi:hypothetical protein
MEIEGFLQNMRGKKSKFGYWLAMISLPIGPGLKFEQNQTRKRGILSRLPEAEM